MLRIAIGGGIGSGKSAVTQILRGLGAKVVVADEVNAELLLDEGYIERIANIFPAAVHNHRIDKKELAAVVYADEGKRRLLMQLAHPLIFEKMFAVAPGEKVVFYEVPLLSECVDRFDRIWFVDADDDLRVKRIMARDGVDEDRARRLIFLQREEDKLKEIASVVLPNTLNISDLRKMVEEQYYLILRHFS